MKITSTIQTWWQKFLEDLKYEWTPDEMPSAARPNPIVIEPAQDVPAPTPKKRPRKKAKVVKKAPRKAVKTTRRPRKTTK